ncbi:MAG: hypothetical protein MSS41_04550, partial [Collinsella sp.]|nr:hypothetical protein [Collinsella sp.]
RGPHLDNLTFNFKGATRRSAPFRFTSPCLKCDPLAVAGKTSAFLWLSRDCRSGGFSLTSPKHWRCRGSTCQKGTGLFWQVLSGQTLLVQWGLLYMHQVGAK